MEKAGAVLRELTARGVEVNLRYDVMRQWLPRVANGTVAAAALAAFWDAPPVLKGLAHLDPARQRELAAGATVDVLTAVDAPPVPMTLRDAYAGGHCKTLLVAGCLLDPAQQAVQLKARAKRAKAKEPAVVDPPSEDDVAALSAEILRVLASRGGAKLTPRLAAETAYAFGWRARR